MNDLLAIVFFLVSIVSITYNYILTREVQELKGKLKNSKVYVKGESK